MPLQRVRSRNMRAIASRLEREGITGQDAVAKYLGPAFTPRRLASMLCGNYMEAMTVWALEHRLMKPKGWMDTDRLDEIASMPLPPRAADGSMVAPAAAATRPAVTATTWITAQPAEVSALGVSWPAVLSLRVECTDRAQRPVIADIIASSNARAGGVVWHAVLFGDEAMPRRLLGTSRSLDRVRADVAGMASLTLVEGPGQYQGNDDEGDGGYRGNRTDDGVLTSG